MTHEVLVAIESDGDLVEARAAARALATRLGFSRTDATLIATAISEVARNIIVHVGTGRIMMSPLEEEMRCGLQVVAEDKGAGIRDVEAALHDGYAGRGGLGLGLSGAKRLMDDFDIDTKMDRGTRVTMTKWRFRDELERMKEKRQRRP
ncbi:MAG TPA: ATP-binding protein [Gaiellaceae bacterium]|nr:ATP-binding protein [Gaiellaceae bacterium]